MDEEDIEVLTGKKIIFIGTEELKKGRIHVNFLTGN